MSKCCNCLEKDVIIHDLENEVEKLKKIINSQKKKEKDGPFGSSTPSSKVPIKPNTKEDNEETKGGAKKGHKGNGRRKACHHTADKVDILYNKIDICPECEESLISKGYQERTIIDLENNKPQKILYKCEKKYCKKCKKLYKATPNALERSLYGNGLIAEALVMHYFHGIPLGRIEQIFGENIVNSSLLKVFHRVAKILESSEGKIIDDYRKSIVKHADETGWRTDGKSGFAWIFCSDNTTIFRHRNTRGSIVAKEVFGDKELEGFLVVDRYGGYNRIKCEIQYCYAHLLRAVKDLGKEFNSEEVQTFVSNLSYYLSEAMHLRNLSISDEEYYKRAEEIKESIIKVIESPASNFGIKNIQSIFKENQHRLYQWCKNRKVPPDNNRAERELRPTVVSRKVSFGSQSAKGARTREIIMTFLHTASKRVKSQPLELWFKNVLDKAINNPNIDCYDLLKDIS